MVVYLIGILILVITLYLNLVVSNKLLYPPVIFSLIWILVLILHWLNSSPRLGIEVFPLRGQAIFFLVGMNILFSLACYFSYVGLQSLSQETAESGDNHRIVSHYRIDRLFFEILNILSIIFALLYLRKAFLITSSFDLGGPFIKELRAILNYHNGDFGWIKYTVVIINTNYFTRLLLFHKAKQNFVGLVLAFVLAMGVAILNTGRTFVFFILIFTFSYWLLNTKVSFKKLLLAALSLAFFFSLVGFLTEKGADLEADFFSNISTMFQSFTEYLLGPVTAFQEQMHMSAHFHFGRNTFRSVYALLYDLNLIDTPPQNLVQQFIHIPFRTNAYTIFSPYFLDFGYVGVSVFMVLLGGLYGLLYYFSTVNRLFFQYLFLILALPLFMSFFQDMFFSLLSQWIQYLLFALVVFGLFVHKTLR
jgi:oligosaccharide repeat unit polymerase